MVELHMSFTFIPTERKASDLKTWNTFLAPQLFSQVVWARSAI